MTDLAQHGQGRPWLAVQAGVAVIACLAFLFPVLMILANKSAPLSLAVAALCGMGAVALAQDWHGLKARLVERLSDPVALALLVTAAFCLLSFLWTVSLPRSWRSLIEIVPVIAAGLLAGMALPGHMRGTAAKWLLWSILAAAALFLFEWAFDMPIRRFFGGRAFASDLKRSITPLAVLVWPAIALLPRGQGRAKWGIAAVAAAALCAGLAHSGSALLGVAAGAGTFVLAWIAPRLAIALAGAVTVAVMAMSVLTGPIMDRALPAAVDSRIERFNASHRIQIWTAFGERIAERPLLGHGFGVSHEIGEAARPAGMPANPASDAMINNIHPHNAPLQIWAEMGAVGALLALAIAGMVLWRFRLLPPDELAPRLAAYASVVAISLVGFGMWQPWWIATISAAMVWFALARCPGSGMESGKTA